MTEREEEEEGEEEEEEERLVSLVAAGIPRYHTHRATINRVRTGLQHLLNRVGLGEGDKAESTVKGASGKQ